VNRTCCPPDAIIVAPATFNTINKWAAGIADTLALGLVCEAIGMGLPVVVLPYLNAAQAKHPALVASVERLRGCEVRVLFGPDVLPVHRPREGRREQFPWHLTLAALDDF
jgi:phosphopantothenoylcysteine decarboxylase